MGWEPPLDKPVEKKQEPVSNSNNEWVPPLDKEVNPTQPTTPTNGKPAAMVGSESEQLSGSTSNLAGSELPSSKSQVLDAFNKSYPGSLISQSPAEQIKPKTNVYATTNRPGVVSPGVEALPVNPVLNNQVDQSLSSAVSGMKNLMNTDPDYGLTDKQKSLIKKGVEKENIFKNAMDQYSKPENGRDLIDMADVQTQKDVTSPVIQNNAEYFLISEKKKNDDLRTTARKANNISAVAASTGKSVQEVIDDEKSNIASEMSSRERDFNFGDNEYFKSVLDEYQLKNEIERLKSTGVREGSPAYELLKEKEREYSKLNLERFKKVDDAHKLIESYLKREDLNSTQRKYLNDKLEEVKALRGDFISTDLDQTAKNMSSVLSDETLNAYSMMPDNLSDKEKFDLWYKITYDKANSIYSRLKEKGTDLQGVREALSWETFDNTLQSIGITGDDYFSLSEDEKQYMDIMRDLRVMSAPFFLNSAVSSAQDNEGFMAGAARGVRSTLAPRFASESLSQNETYGLMGQIMSEAGFSPSNEAQAEFMKGKSIPKKLLGEGFRFYNPLSWGDVDPYRLGEMTGTTMGIMAPMMITSPMVGGVVKAAGLVNKLSKVRDAYVSYMKSAPTLARWAGNALDEAVNYEAAGNVFTNTQDELNFMSGFLGTFVGDRFKAGVGKALDNSLTTAAMNQTRKIFGDKGVRYLASIGDKAIGVGSRGVGELAEETTQTLYQIWQETPAGKGFISELRDRFPDMSSIEEFTVASFFMGAGMGIKSSSDVFKNKYKELSTESRAKIDPILSEIANTIAASTNEAVVTAGKDQDINNELSNQNKKETTNETKEEVQTQEGEQISQYTNKQLFEKTIRESFVNATDEQVNSAMKIAEARANVWSKQTGKNVDEWYSGKTAVKSDPETVKDNPVLYQFVGENARLSEEESQGLQVAKEMHDSGSDVESIWQETGWYMDPADDKWKMEVPESDAPKKFFIPENEDGTIKIGESIDLSEVVDIPELFRLAPWASEYQVVFTNSENYPDIKDSMGLANEYEKKVYINTEYNKEDMYSTLRHEIQHILQADSGFQTGTAPSEFVNNTGASNRTAKIRYFKSAGEVEARNVENRLKLFEDEKKSLSPEKTMTDQQNELMNPDDRITTEYVDIKEDSYKFKMQTVAQKNMGKKGALYEVTHDDGNIKGVKKLNQGAKGAIEFGPADMEATVHAFESADITTLIHEMFHMFRRDIYHAMDNAKDDATKSSIQSDIKLLEEYAGVTDGNWSVEAEEKVARAGERYMKEGVAPSKELEGVFSKMKDWFSSIYKTIKGSPIDVKVNDNIKGVFDRMLSEETKQTEEATKNYKEKAKSIADKIRSLKPEDLEGVLSANKFVYDAINLAIEAVAKSVELGGSIAQAVSDGLSAFRETEFFNSLSDTEKANAESKLEKELTARVKSFTDQTINEKPKDEGKEKVRKSADTILNSTDLDEKVKEAIIDVRKYNTRSRTENINVAEKIINKFGPVVAANLLMSKKASEIDPSIQVSMGILLVKSSKELAAKFESEGNIEKAEALRTKVAELANHMMKYMTELGRGVDMFNMFKELDASTMLKASIDLVNESVRQKIDKSKGKIDDFIDKYSMAEQIALSNSVDVAMEQIGSTDESVSEKLKPVAKEIANNGVTDSIVEKISSITGKEKSESSKIAKAMSDEFNSSFQSEREAIKNRMGHLGPRLSGAISKIIEGEKPLSSEEISKIIEEYYGIVDVDKDFADKIAKERDVIDKLKTETEKNSQAIKIASMIYKYTANKRFETAKKIQGLRKVWPVTSTWLSSKFPTSPAETLWSYWYANTLSGVSTQYLNIMANVYKTFIELPLTAIEALIPNIEKSGTKYASSSTMIKLPGGRVITYPDLVRAIGIFKSFAQGSLTKGLSEGANTLAYGASANVRSDLKGTSGMIDALEEMPFKWYNAAFHPLKFVKRAMSSADEFFFSGAERMNMYNMAMVNARELGLKGEELSKYIAEAMGVSSETISKIKEQAVKDVESDEKVSGSKYGPIKKKAMISRRYYELWEIAADDRLIEKSKEFSRRWTYNNKPEGVIGSVANGIESIKAKPHVAAVITRLLVPFTRVPANVMNEYLDYSPVGFFRAKSKDTKTAKRMQFIKAMTGTALMAMVFAGFDDDDESGITVNGAGPTDINKKQQLMESGWIPFSIKIGDKYISYKNSPLFISLSVIGNAFDAKKYDEDITDEDIATQMVYSMQTSMAGFLDASYLSGVNGVLSSIQDSRGDLESMSKTMSNVLVRPASGFIPYKGMLSYIDRTMDPTIYKTKGFKAALMSNIPFMRRTTGEKLNVLGEPVEYSGKLFNDKIEDPIWNFMFENDLYFPSIPYKPVFPDNYGGREMNEKEAEQFTILQGKYMKEYMNSFIIDKVKELLKEDGGKDASQELINKFMNKARRRAKQEVYMMSNGFNKEDYGNINYVGDYESNDEYIIY